MFVLSDRPPPRATLFPYTTLFRSQEGPQGRGVDQGAGSRRGEGGHRPVRLLRLGRDARRYPRHRAAAARCRGYRRRSEEHTSELQSHVNLVCRLLLEKKKITTSSA